MVLGYALLGVTEHREECAQAIARAPAIWVPDLFRSEFLSVVARWLRSRALPVAEGLEVLRETESLLTEVVPASALWEDALRLAAEREHSAYDTLFVALAIQRNSRLLTYDEELLGKFPERTLRVEDFLRAAGNA